MIEYPVIGGERKTNRKKLLLSLLLIAVSVGAGLSTVLVLRTSATCPSCLPPRFIYSAKYLCGEFGLSGFYLTTVNIHNPSISANATIFSALVSQALTPSAGPLSQPAPVKITLGLDSTLQTLRSFRLSCFDIQNASGGSDGFVSITTDSSSLDVVAVYTVSPTQQTCAAGCIVLPGNATSVEVETILPKPLV